MHVEEVSRGGVTQVLLLHGILGRGRNWRTIANRLVEARRDLSVLLPDLRGHGESVGLGHPMTLSAVVDDVTKLVSDRGVSAVVGHSFGGKVAALQRANNAVATWLLDSNPGVRLDGMEDPSPTAPPRVLDALDRVAGDHASRGAFVDALVGEGLAKPVAQWLAMQLATTDAGVQFALDTNGIRALLRDYYATDAWPALGDGDGVHLVAATRSQVIDATARAHAKELGIDVHDVSAGHWLHVDAPDVVVGLLAETL